MDTMPLVLHFLRYAHDNSNYQSIYWVCNVMYGLAYVAKGF
jgi:hypothetical protein